MRRYALRRLLLAVPTLLATVAIAFMVIRLAPGSPFSADKALSPLTRAALEHRYGLDAPLWLQLWRYLSGLLTGDLGPSLRYGSRPVSELIALGAPVTLTVAALALLVTLLVALALALPAVYWRGSIVDHALSALAGLAAAVPTYVVAPLLVLAFALTLYWLPPAGTGGFSHYVLPSLSLGLVYGGVLARLLRAGLVDAHDAELTRALRARGLSELAILLRHTLPRGAVPAIGLLGPLAAQLCVGSLVVERIFALPGIGAYAVEAALERDYFLFMGVVIVLSALLVTFDLAADCAQAALDPRLRH